MISVLVFPLVGMAIAGPGKPVDEQTAIAAAEAVSEYSRERARA